eukprot:jgi/Tetstr1/453750/TSEL_040703.t1
MGRQTSTDSGSMPSCGLCRGALRGALLCTACVNGGVVGDKKSVLRALAERRRQLLAELEPRLAQRAAWAAQCTQLSALEEQLRHVSVEAGSREQRLRRVRRDAALLAQKNEARSREVTEQMNELANKRTEVLVHHFSDVIRCQGLRHSMVMEQLVTEQRRRLAALLQIFPLQITALRSSTGSANGSETVLPIPCVTVANLRLPDSADQMVLESSQHTQQSTSAALGYMLLLTQLLAHYLGVPTAHVASFGASTSSIWEPASCRQPFPAPGDPPLALFHSAKGAAEPAAARQAGGAGSGPPEPAELRRAVRLLERSTAMVCHAKMGAAARACPEDWGAFALLAWMFAQVNLQHTESTQRIVAAAGMDPRASLCVAPPEASDNAWSGNDAGLSAQMLLGDPDCALDMQDAGREGEDSGEGEDWDLVQRPFLPPPPSQPDEVEHWTRAMFTDASRAPQGSGDSFTRALRQKMPSLSKPASYGQQ